MSELITLGNDNHELSFDITEDNKNIPFIRSYLSGNFSKNDRVFVPDLISACSVVMYPRMSQYIIIRMICENYLGMESDLSILYKIDVHPDDFPLLVNMIDHFGFRCEIVDAICQKLPAKYDREIILRHEKLVQIIRDYYSEDYLFIRTLKGVFHIVRIRDRKIVKSIEKSKINNLVSFKPNDCSYIMIANNIMVLISFGTPLFYKINLDSMEIIETKNIKSNIEVAGSIPSKNIIWFATNGAIILWNFMEDNFKEIEINHPQWDDSLYTTVSNSFQYVICSTKNKIIVLDTKTNNHYQIDCDQEVHNITISPDNQYFIIADEGTMNLYEMKSGKEIFKHDNALYNYFTDDSKYIFIGHGSQRCFEKWDFLEGKIVDKYEFKYSFIGYSGKLLVHQDYNGKIMIYNLENSTKEESLHLIDGGIWICERFIHTDPIINF